MLLRWSCIFLIYFLLDLNKIHCVTKYNPSRSSSSGSSHSSSSLGSSRGSSLGASRPTYSSNSATHGSYGWKQTTKYTTHRPFTQRQSRYYPVTTMPTRRTTTRRYIVTTMPTHRFTTKKHVTTMPTHRTTRSTTRQPPYNPYYSTHRYNNSGSATTRQPAFNPFFNKQNNSNKATSHQPALNPFFNNTRRHNNSNTATSRQPAFNPFFSSSTTRRPIRNNGSIWLHSTPSTLFSTKVTPRPDPFQNHSRPNNGTKFVTSGPELQKTTKITNLGSGNRSWNNSRPATTSPNHNNWTTSWNRNTTQKPSFTAPTWNSSSVHVSGNSGPGIHQPVYTPPGHQTSTVGHPSYVTGSHITYNPHPTNTGTTIINNNNYHYHPGGGYYHPYTGSTSHVTVINNNNYYNGNHRIIIPSHHYYGYGPPAVGVTIVNRDYYSHPISSHYYTTYHYNTIDTGSTALGLYLGYQLGRISRPSYYYHSTTYYNNEYIPRYDHYTVHHYYHNSQSIPKESPIQPNAIVACPGDSGALCPSGNMPLCTNNGAVMCVVSTQSTVPCTDNIQTNCVKSIISCSGNNSPECRQQSQTTVSIPCVSTAKIDASLELVNNSLVVTNSSDSSTKAFCVTILALPAQSKNATQSKPAQNDILLSSPFKYTSNDTGVGLLGYYLGNKLQDLAQPSYSFLNYDENYNYIEKFDHYNIYHYDHDSTILPNVVDIKAEQVMSCAGDSGTFCPRNTTSLCLFDGAVICVSESAIYSQELQANLIYSNISCNNLRSPACISNSNETFSIQIPCISTAKLYAKTNYLIKSYGTGSSIIYYRTLEPVFNTTSAANGTVVDILERPRELCVTVLALPGEKVLTKPPMKRKVTGVANESNSIKLPKYIYSIKETGNTLFGHDLANRLGKIALPTYYYINAYLYKTSGQVQKYDHYSIHYYENGREILPSDLSIQATEINGCDGDSGLICPQKTNSLCLNDGSVWCIKDLMLTKTCNKYNNTACIATDISCEKNKAPQCKNVKTNKKIHLACVSVLTISGNIMAVENRIYKHNVNLAKSYTDIQMLPNSNNTKKAQHFCVTLINIPAERKISEGEKIFENSDSLFGRFASKIFGF